MDILNLDIKNCLTIGQAHLELDGRGLLLIQGVNQDDTSASSNGAGKSSIVDALCWCFYGETARGISGDLIVNDTAKKDCSVFVTLDDGGVKYKIERFRKHSAHKNQLYAWQLDPAGGPSTPLHKGTERETQMMLAKLIGCSLEVFAGSIYAGQEKMPDLPGMTDKFLKLLIEEAAGVEELASAYVMAQKQGTEAAKVFSAASFAYGVAEKQASAALAQLLEANDQVKTFEDARKDRARTALTKVLPLTTELNVTTTALAALDEKALQHRREDLSDELAANNAQQAELTRLGRIQAKAEAEQHVARSELLRLRQTVATASANLLELDKLVGTPCGECGKVYCEHDLADAEASRTAVVTAAIRAQNEQASKCKAAIAAATSAADATSNYRACMTDVSAASAELTRITAALSEMRHLSDKANALRIAIAAHKAEAQLKMKEDNPWRPIQTRRDSALTQARLDEASAKVAVEASIEASELVSDAIKVFGPAGVRAHIIDTVTPFLNARTADYLGAMSDGNIHAVWNTLEKNAKGELKEKFNIAVSNDKGGKTFAAQSGGEKRKVRLSCALALQDMVASRATKPINLFMADEIDDAMDQAGLERLMGVLERKAKERGTVLIISHNSLADWCDQVITVTKSGGVSTITGATVRGF